MVDKTAAQSITDHNEDRFLLAMHGANDGLWDWNLESDEVYYSPRWKTMLGYEEDEFAASIETWKSLVHPDDREYVLEKVQDYISGKADSFEAEMRMRHKEGHCVYVLSRGYLANHDHDDKPSRLIGTHVDITEMKNSERFILETSNILKMIATGEPASAIYDAIALLYEARHPGMRCSMLTLEGNKLRHGGAPSLPKEYCNAVDGLENGPSVGSCGTSTYTGKTVLVEDIDTDPKWAKIKHVALPHGLRCCWSEPIKNASGKVLGAFGMYYNHAALPNEKELSDLKSAARLAAIIMHRDYSDNEIAQHKRNLEDQISERTLELEKAKKAAEQASLAKSEFLSSMSHELRTPLNAIIGFSQILECDPKQPLTDAQIKSVNHIKNGGAHLLDLVNGVLELAKIESDNIELSMEHLMPSKIFRECLELMRPMANAQNITMSGKPGDIEGIFVDHTSFKQIVLNLMSNGIKYNTPGGELNFGCEKFVGDKVRIFVHDTGPGIPLERQHELFMPFNRLGKETSEIEGTGIGLTVTKKMVEAMDGEISFESDPDKGTTFWVTFPRRGPDEHTIDVETSTVNFEPIEKKEEAHRVILYIDDNPSNLQLMKAIIEHVPAARLKTAHNAELGLLMAQENNPDLIIMDINLPGMDGIQALGELRAAKETRDIPVIALSAGAMPKQIQRGKEAGFQEYLTKPVDVPKTLATIIEYID